MVRCTPTEAAFAGRPLARSRRPARLVLNYASGLANVDPELEIVGRSTPASSAAAARFSAGAPPRRCGSRRARPGAQARQGARRQRARPRAAIQLAAALRSCARDRAGRTWPRTFSSAKAPRSPRRPCASPRPGRDGHSPTLRGLKLDPGHARGASCAKASEVRLPSRVGRALFRQLGRGRACVGLAAPPGAPVSSARRSTAASWARWLERASLERFI